MNSINQGWMMKHNRGILGRAIHSSPAYMGQWPWRSPVETRLMLVWDRIATTPVVSFRETPRGNTIVENHPDLPFPSTVLYSGRTVLRDGIVPPVTQSVRITRTGGW